MDFNTLASNQSIETLKCSVCKNFLSYFPISVSSNNQNICGRCTIPKGLNFFQNTAFETISQFVTFPCRYKPEGCLQELPPKNMPQHEKKCLFRVIQCCSSLPCEWQGTHSELLNHCQAKHSEMFLKNGEFDLELSLNDNSDSLLEHNNTLLIFKREFDCKHSKLLCAIYNCQYEPVPKSYSCQLTVKSSNKSLSVDFDTTSYDQLSYTEMCLDSIRKGSGTQLACCKLTLNNVIDESVDQEKTNSDMLAVLKCIICAQFALPPIYHCLKDSGTLCSECNQTHQSACATCLRSSTQTRNFNLDKLANMLSYPCKYQHNGCSHASTPDQIKLHQSQCELADFDCPIGEFEACDWKGLLRNLSEHIQNNHQELVSNLATLSKQLMPQRMKCDVLRVANRLFRLVCVRTPEERYLWTVQVIGPCEDKFKFEIEIVDPGKGGRRLLVRQECGGLTKKEELFGNGGSFCYFVKDQVRSFVLDQVITFKVHIFK